MCSVFIVSQGSNGDRAHFVYCLFFQSFMKEEVRIGIWSVKGTLEDSELGALPVTLSLLHRDLQTGILISKGLLVLGPLTF